MFLESGYFKGIFSTAY